MNKTKNPIKKWANYLDASLKKMIDIISHGGNANKTTMKYYSTPIRMAKMIKTDHTKS